MKDFVLKTKDFMVSGEEFSLIYNEKYDFLQTEPQPEIHTIHKYYQSKEYISHTDGNKNWFEKIYQIVKKYTITQKIKLLEKYFPKKGSLLDIGAGTGDFLEIAKNRNWEITGIEPEQKAIEIASKKGVFLYKNQEEIKNTFDVITLWHALEHIPDLQKQIDFLKNHLKKNGILIIAVPNYKSKDAQIYKEYWAAYDVPRHLWHFSQKSIQLLFNEHNFKIIKTKPMYFDAFYVSLLSEKYKTGKMNLIKGVFNGLYSNISAIKTGEYSSLLYVLKRN